METGKMIRRSAPGQVLVEMALVLPILLVLIVGAYAAARSAFLHSRSASVSFTEALRAGRNLRGIEKELSRTVLPEGGSVSIQASERKGSGLLPLPSVSLSGRTSAAVEVRKPWPEIGDPDWLPPVSIRQESEFYVDCWNSGTGSGKRIGRWILGAVALGSVR